MPAPLPTKLDLTVGQGLPEFGNLWSSDAGAEREIEPLQPREFRKTLKTSARDGVTPFQIECLQGLQALEASKTSVSDQRIPARHERSKSLEAGKRLGNRIIEPCDENCGRVGRKLEGCLRVLNPRSVRNEVSKLIVHVSRSRPPNVPGLSSAGRAQREPRLLQAGVGRRCLLPDPPADLVSETSRFRVRSTWRCWRMKRASRSSLRAASAPKASALRGGTT